MSISYTYVGVRHFIDPDFFLAIMPNYLPYHLEFVYISGIAEISFGVLLFFKKIQQILETFYFFKIIHLFRLYIHILLLCDYLNV